MADIKLTDAVIPTLTVVPGNAITYVVHGGVSYKSSKDDFLAEKADLVSGKVPAAQLPSYVDDVIEVDDYADLPVTGEVGKIYVTVDDNKQYRWTGTAYIVLGGGDSVVYSGAIPILSSDLSSQDADGFVDYINALNPPMLVLSSEILYFKVTDTGQIFRLLLNDNDFGLGSPAITTDDVLDFGNNDGLATTASVTILAGTMPFSVITEGGNTGAARKGRTAANYGNIGDSAIDISLSSTASATKGATGYASFATGMDTTASATGSTAMGIGTKATAQDATAMGQLTEATGVGATAMGTYSQATGQNATATGGNTKANGDNSFSAGSFSEAKSFSETAIGIYGTTPTPASATAHDVTDRVFGIGIGTSAGAKKDAMLVLKSGLVTHPELTTALIEAETTGKVVVTKEYLSNNSRYDFFIQNAFGYILPTFGASTFNALRVNSITLQNNAGVFENPPNILFASTSTAGTLAFQRGAVFYIDNSTATSYIYDRKFKFNNNVTDTRFFCGIAVDTATAAPTNVEPNTLTRLIGVCKLSGSQNLHFIHNDLTGTATTVDLGSNFPANNTTAYWYHLKITKLFDATINLTLYRTDVNGNVISTTLAITSDYEAVSNHFPVIWITNNATASISGVKDYGVTFTQKNKY